MSIIQWPQEQGMMMAELRRRPARRILVVDDDPNAVALMRLVLMDAGFEVDCADSAASAIELAERAPPETLITDFKLPSGSSAIDVVRCVKERVPDARIILVTGAAREDVLASLENLNQCIVLQKPIDVDHLLKVVQARS